MEFSFVLHRETTNSFYTSHVCFVKFITGKQCYKNAQLKTTKDATSSYQNVGGRVKMQHLATSVWWDASVGELVL